MHGREDVIGPEEVAARLHEVEDDQSEHERRQERLLRGPLPIEMRRVGTYHAHLLVNLRLVMRVHWLSGPDLDDPEEGEDHHVGAHEGDPND